MTYTLYHKTIASALLGLFVYALTYTGIHQLSNPAQMVKECAFVDHHLHQNPETHSCDLCDYHLKLEVVTIGIGETKQVPLLLQPHGDWGAVCLKQFNLSSLRAPPQS